MTDRTKTGEDEMVERVALGAVATAARDFCAELCEDADGVPQPELARLHRALDVWEASPDDTFGLYDDSTPESAVLAALKWVAEDGSETDRTRRAAAMAIGVIEALQRVQQAMTTDTRLSELGRRTDPTSWGDSVAYVMRDYYEANRPLRWWEKRNPPGSWGCIADDLMLGLLNMALAAHHARAAALRARAASATGEGL